MAGIYIHVPFCRQACHYCDFHFSTKTSNAEGMVHAMVQEAQMRWTQNPAWHVERFRTLYLGGGTPSLLSPALSKTLLEGVAEACHVQLEDLDEVTLEANPEDLTPASLAAWKDAGVTRLSVGIQSFDDNTLKWMNRAHTGVQAVEGILRANRAGFHSITVDLIYGVPTDRNWGDDVKRALELPVRHLSAYALTVEPRTVLGTRVSRGDEPEPSDARAADEYQHLCAVAAQRGWLHYETSNWAAPLGSGEFGKALHNSSYWSGEAYLGLGPGAHGFLGGVRYANVSNNPLYLQSLNQGRLQQTEEALSDVDRYNERVMTGLRTALGISPEELAHSTGHRPDEVDPQAWRRALESGDLIPLDAGHFRVPEDRWITGDRVASSLFLVS
jgi:oxygen-independent coproporphyrinogen-3 oxidase